MPASKWTEDDIAKLKSMAGKFPARDIAAELGRSWGAVAVEASKLKLSLRRISGRRDAATASSAPTHP